MNKKKIYFLPLIATLICFLFPGQQADAAIQIVKQGKSIMISGELEDPSSIEIRIYSSRNHSISSYLEVSSQNPDAKQLKSDHQQFNWDIFYPVIDVVPSERMQGVAEFDQSLNTLYSANGMFNEALFIMKGNKLIIDNEYLLNWENNIYIDSDGARMTSFYLRDNLGKTGNLNVTYTLLSESWSGEIVIWSLNEDKEIARRALEDTYENPEQGTLAKYADAGLSRERLMASLAATLKYTIGSQDKSAYGNTHNGLNLFYDAAAKTYRRPTWAWGWGPSIKLLVESAEIPEIQEEIPPYRLIQTAVEIGETSLKFQISDPASPAYGIIMSRWSENKGTLLENYGFEEYYSIADAQFLAGWGWIPLYKATGDERYLEGARLLTETTGKLTQAFDIIPMDYMVRAGRWKDYALNEQGFATEGINELFKIDPDPDYQKIGDEYMKMLLEKFEAEGGVWNRLYRIDKDEPVPAAYHTRGVGWAMEGLLAVYELTGDPDYLEKARIMAGHLQENQLPDGSWSYNFKSKDTNEISEKGTALWSLLFYKLYGFTNDPEHLSVARKALAWCLDNQYDGPDLHAFGGIIGISRQSGVIYRQWFPLSCSYTSGFFGLAVLEELKIQQ